MAQPTLASIHSQPLERLRPLFGDAWEQLEQSAAQVRAAFAGRTVWHVNSTLRGGGVAEMLRSLLPYVRAAGVDTRWVALQEPAGFFELTKRIHNNLHGSRGDGGPLGGRERDLYTRTLEASAGHLTPLIRPGDIVFLHDPQTAGLTRAVRAAGATAVWRCHIGIDRPDETVHRAWDFLRPEIETADAWVFSRPAYVWEGLDPDRVWIMAPSIDPLSPKNQELEPAVVDGIIRAIGLGPEPAGPAPVFTRADGSAARVVRRAEILQESHLPPDAAVVTQISRWDRLKDHPGLLTSFSRHLAGGDLHLVLAGPATAAVADDPEGAVVWSEIVTAWRDLPTDVRRLVHLVSLPMDDIDENAVMVNALQRRADVVVQKSLAEGFGLTVAEAMWKSRPVIGTRVGGIQDQIAHGDSGLLVDDPTDLEALAQAISSITGDRGRAAAIGEQARRRVFERYLAPNRLIEYSERLAATSSS